jgi:hypothetical protein
MRPLDFGAWMFAALAAIGYFTPTHAAGTGTIYVSRGSGLFGSASIAVDGNVVGTVGYGECIRIQVAAGKRVVTSPNFFGTFYPRARVTVNVPAGGHVYIFAKPSVEFPGPVYWDALSVEAKGRRC